MIYNDSMEHEPNPFPVVVENKVDHPLLDPTSPKPHYSFFIDYVRTSSKSFCPSQTPFGVKKSDTTKASSFSALIPRRLLIVFFSLNSGFGSRMDSGLSDWVNYLEEESYPVARDFLVLPLFVLLFPSLRLFLDTFVFERLARWLILGKEQKIVQTHDERKKVNKFKESAWKCLYFFSAEALALSVTYNEPWFSNTKHFWVGPGDQVWPEQKTKLKLKALYMYSAGFYMYSSFALVFWETRRSDFWASMAHHIATTILIVFSYIARFSRVGSIILALHEGCDVFLEIAKMSKYTGLELIASVSFVMFVLSWTILRLIYFPFWIIWSTSYEVLLNLDKEKHMVDGSIYYYLFNTLLICLLILHIYWWKLMVSMLIKQIRSWGKLDDDVRSDSEDEDDEHED